MQEKNNPPLSVGDCVELLPPFVIYTGLGRLCVFIQDETHLHYIQTHNYRIIEKNGSKL